MITLPRRGSTRRIASGLPQRLLAPVRPVFIAASKRCCWWPRAILWLRRPAAAASTAPACTAGPPDESFGPRSADLAARIRAEHEASALIDRPRSGRPRRHPRLTPQRLAAALARDPRRCGYQATSWTVPLLAHDLAAKGLAVSPRTLRRRLHEAGYRWKRPRYVYVARAPHLAQKKGASPAV